MNFSNKTYNFLFESKNFCSRKVLLFELLFSKYNFNTKVEKLIDIIDRRLGRQSNLFKQSILELNRRGLNDHITAHNRKTNSEQRPIRSVEAPVNNSDTTPTTATTTMTAANHFSLLAAKFEVTITSHVDSAMNNSATGYQPDQQIIAVNRFTTNQYIIKTGGPIEVPLPDNLVNVTQHYVPTNSAFYGMNTASCYNNNNDLNNSQIGYFSF